MIKIIYENIHHRSLKIRVKHSVPNVQNQGGQKEFEIAVTLTMES